MAGDGPTEYLSRKDVERLEEASQVVSEKQPVSFRDGSVFLKASLPAHAIAAITVEFKPEMKVLEPSLTDEELSRLERDTFKYFADEINLENGLVPDSTKQGSPSSIAVVGFALTAYPIAVERKYLSRAEAVKRTLTRCAFSTTRRTERTGRDRLQRFLLSLPRHEDRPPCVEV